MLNVGDRVRVRVKPRENRGAYRVTKTAWTEQTYQITGIEHTDMGPLFTLRGWQGGKTRGPRPAQGSGHGGKARARLKRGQER